MQLKSKEGLNPKCRNLEAKASTNGPKRSLTFFSFDPISIQYTRKKKMSSSLQLRTKVTFAGEFTMGKLKRKTGNTPR